MKISDLHTLLRHFSRLGDVILLDSQSSEHTWSRISYLAAMPNAKIKSWDDRIEITKGDSCTEKQGNPWELLQDFQVGQDDWLFGYLGYDLKNYAEDLASGNSARFEAPDMYFMNPGFLLQIDRKTGEIELLKGELPSEADIDLNRNGLSDHFILENFRPTLSKDEYLQRIREAQFQITEGEFYEITLTHQMKGNFSGNPFGLYQKMKESGPVPFAAFLQIDDFSVCCQSPERFLRKEGQTVFSQPIKGTSERSTNSQEDEVFRQRLSSSPKEQAENLMIVDLVRNDLGRIAQKGSVQVPSLFEIESFETVHQMVSTISAEAAVDGPVQILKACFPMGSMTGAPKISAMKSIDKLENYRRKVYSGAIGYITPDNNFDFNVVIRTALIQDESLYYPVGGAITSDSDPVKEWRETLIKARALSSVLDDDVAFDFDW